MVSYYESIGNQPADSPIIRQDQISTQLEPTLKLMFASLYLLIFGFTLPKLSILTLYVRIFTGRKTRFFTYVLMVLVLAMGVAFGVAGIFACRPVQYFWNKTIINGQCFHLNFYYQSFGLPQILIDAAILITPLPAIWGLQTSRSRRLGITLIFLTGVIGMIVSCIRWDMYSRADVYTVKPSESPGILF